MYDITLLRFSRCLTPIGALSPMLVIFCDASKIAYGCCAYVRWELLNGSGLSKLIVAKSKSAPRKEITIPRLELSAAVLASRLRETIVNEMDIMELHVNIGIIVLII